jgi:hypothetical protein
MSGTRDQIRDAMKAAHEGAPNTERADLPAPTPAKAAPLERRTTLSVSVSLAKRLKRAALEADTQVQALAAEILDLELSKRGF